MKNLETSITIAAPIQTVWNILTSFEEYPSWNPFITKIEGELKMGGQLSNTLMINGKPNYFQPNIITLEEGRKFEWLGSGPLGMFNGQHYFELEDLGNNQTKLIHGEHFSGWLRWLIMLMIGKETKRGFEAMNAALKARAEAMTQA